MKLLQKSPLYVVFGGGVTVFITLGLNHSNGLFLLPITTELNSGRELFSLAGKDIFKAIFIKFLLLVKYSTRSNNNHLFLIKFI